MASALLLLPLADFDGHMDWDGGWGAAMVIGMLIFWGLVIAVAVWLAREFGAARHPEAKGDGEQPLRILDKRLAEGLISVEEYQQRRSLLLDADERGANQPG